MPAPPAGAYAARAGLAAVVLAPASAPRSKLAQIMAAGARLVPLTGNTSDCCRLARSAARFGWVNVTTTYYNSVGVDAYATVAYEIAGVRPDVVLLPISSGPLLAGVMKGFERLKRLGLADRLPRPVAVQPSACAPTVRAFETGKLVAPRTRQPTAASALNDTLAGYERDGDYTFTWIRRHGGSAVAVSDDDILEAVRGVATREEIFVELSAAAPVAAIRQLVASGWLGPDERVVAVATGHGLKDISDAVIPELQRRLSWTRERSRSCSSEPAWPASQARAGGFGAYRAPNSARRQAAGDVPTTRLNSRPKW